MPLGVIPRLMADPSTGQKAQESGSSSLPARLEAAALRAAKAAHFSSKSHLLSS